MEKQCQTQPFHEPSLQEGNKVKTGRWSCLGSCRRGEGIIHSKLGIWFIMLYLTGHLLGWVQCEAYKQWGRSSRGSQKYSGIKKFRRQKETTKDDRRSPTSTKSPRTPANPTKPNIQPKYFNSANPSTSTPVSSNSTTSHYSQWRFSAKISRGNPGWY